jgi:hypothetical protein
MTKILEGNSKCNIIMPSTAGIANKIRRSSNVLHMHIQDKNNGHFPKELAMNISVQTLHCNIL